MDKAIGQKSTWWTTMLIIICASVLLYFDKIGAEIWLASTGLGGVGYMWRETKRDTNKNGGSQ